MIWKTEKQAALLYACFSVFQSRKVLEGNKCYSGSRSKLHVSDFPIIDAPIHITGNHMSILQNLLHNCYVPQTICPFYPRLQVNNRTLRRSARNMPVEVTCASCPFPGVCLRFPWHIDAMQLMVAIACPPCTLTVRKIIASAFDRRIGGSWLVSRSGFTWNTNSLTPVDNIRIGDMVIRDKSLPGGVITSCDAT